MNLLIYIPLAVIGAAIGSVVNLAVYRLAWRQRSYSPWSAPLEDAPPRHWRDRIPIVGWFGLRREAPLHGAGFWIRPMLVEVVTAVGLIALCWWEVDQRGLIRPAILQGPPLSVLYGQVAIHAFLFALMLAGSLIDVDEKTIPDGITVTGTLVALALAAVFPCCLLPDAERAPAGLMGVAALPNWDFLKCTSPNLWPDWMNGFPRWNSLLLALGCWWGWCFALMPRTWYDRHGWKRALELCVARLKRDPTSYRAATMAVVGVLLITFVWWIGGRWPGIGLERWQGLLTSLVGMAAGGCIIWAVRIIATSVLHQEAMGFGDVTLMAMLGAFLGWQACFIIFFLAPFAGLVMGICSLILHRQREIPYGPFLCMAAAVVLIWWAPIWMSTEPTFQLGAIIAPFFAFGLVLMAGMLWVWRAIRQW